MRESRQAICPNCGEIMDKRASRCKRCWCTSGDIRRGTGKGFYMRHGRKCIFVGQHPKADKDGFVEESVLIYEDYSGHRLARDEVVHHIDGNKVNNCVANLCCMLDGKHRQLHSQQRMRTAKGRWLPQMGMRRVV